MWLNVPHKYLEGVDSVAEKEIASLEIYEYDFETFFQTNSQSQVRG